MSELSISSFFKEANEKYSAKEYEEAIKLYEKSIENKFNEANSWFNMSVCFLKLGEYEKSKTSVKKALKLRLDAKYLFNLAYCYMKENDYKNALLYFNYSWALNNDDLECEKAINSLLKTLKNIM